MKKNVISVLLSVVLAAGSVGASSVWAAEASVQESVYVQEGMETEEGSAQGDSVYESEQTSGKESDEASDEAANADNHDRDEAANEDGRNEDEDAAEDASTDRAEGETASGETALDEAASEEDLENAGDTSEEAGEIAELPIVEEEGETVASEEIALAENLVDSGTCGENATWTLTGTDGNLTLTISGSGDMYDDYDSATTPWISKRADIRTVNVEEGITSVSDFAFYECRYLTDVTLADSATAVGSDVFCGCSSLVNVKLPKGMTAIEYSVFQDCSSLISITIPESVRSIWPNAFSGCSSLKNITLPDGLKTLSSSAFHDCSRLTEITIPGGIKTIGENAFSNCNRLESVILSDGIQQIDNNAFSGCSSLAKIAIPDTVSKIGNSVFSGCSSLTEITLPNAVTWIGKSTFSGCSSLKSITIPAGVYWIQESAFSGCDSLTNISIPERVRQISNGAFSGCTSLKNIVLPDEVTAIEGNVFFNCSSLTSIKIPDKVARIEGNAFSGCTSLNSIVIPDRVTQIGAGAFTGCTGLTNITLSRNVTKIEANLFSNCSSLSMITIPGVVTQIEGGAFSGCSSLKNITIPEKVTRIEQGTFSNCENLSSITIPNKVSEIGPGAFYGCRNLKKIVILENVTHIDSDAFDADYGKSVDVYTVKGCTADGYFTDKNHNWRDIFTLHYFYDPTCVSRMIYPRLKKIVIETGDIVSITNFLLLTDGASADSIEVTGYNSNVLFFDAGQLAALSEGNTTIKVTCGEETIRIPVSVVDKAEEVTDISFDAKTMTIPFNGAAHLVLNVAPNNAVLGTVKWRSSNPGVVSVDNGLLRANEEGKATITATMTGGTGSNAAPVATCEVTVTEDAEAIIAFDEVTVERGETEKLYYNVYPAISDVTTPYEFESDDPDVVEVSEDGVLFGKTLGTANVTITNGHLSKTIKVTVKIGIRGISFDKKLVRIPEERTAPLKVIYDPEDTTDDRTITWTSSNSNIASVDENGLVTALSKGIATITATVGEFSAKCSVVCVDSSIPVIMTGIELPGDETMEYGMELAPEVTYLPEDTTDDRTVNWKSGNTKIFTVSKDGVVTPTGIGKATLTATVGDFTASMKITVIKGTPSYEKPGPVNAYCGQQLSDFELPAGFAWDDPDSDVGSAGTNSFTVTFTPDDTVHFNKVERIVVLTRVAHVFPDQWTIGSERHWHECVCGEMADEAAHEYSSWKVTRKAGCEEYGQKERTCKVCGRKLKETIPANGHFWEEEYTIDVEPTYEKEGSESIHCSVCGKSEPGTERTIPKKDDPFSVDAAFTLDKTVFNYTGGPITPGMTVTYKDVRLEEGTDYSVAYSNNIDPGTANVDVYGIGKYTGVKHLQFKIRIGATKKVTCTNVASGMKVSWEKVDGATRYKVYRDGKQIFTTSALAVTDKEVKYNNGKKYVYKVVAYVKGIGDSDIFRTGTCYRLMPVGIKSLSNPSAGKMTVNYDKCSGSTGYVVRYGLKSDMSDAKVITVAGANTLSRTFSGMKKGKTYYVQVRTYKLDNGVRYYSGYCTTKTIRIVK